MTLRHLAHRLSNLALDGISHAIGALCHAYPRINERREICQLRMKLTDAYFCIADLEETVRNYRAMHEVQHGETIPSLTLETFAGKDKDLN